MKKIITLILFISLYQICVAQVWTQKNNFGGGVRCGSSSFSIGDTGYVVAGSNGFTFYNDTWMYVTSTDSWTQVASYPGVAGGVKVGFSVNGKGYVGTGTALGYQWYTEFYEYDPSTNTWTPKANFPGTARGYCVAFSLDGKGYIGCGVGGGYPGGGFNAFKDFYEYDPGTDTWTQIANYPGNGSQLDVSFVTGDKAYVGCGITTNSNWTALATDSDFWEYDTTSKAWTRVAGFSGGTREGASGFGTCSMGYVGLGCSDINQTVYDSDFWVYNASQGAGGTWTQIASMSNTGRQLASDFIMGQSVYAGIGNNNTGANMNDWWEYNIVYTPAFTTGGSSSSTICAGDSVMFTDTSNYSPSNWYWQFPGGTPDTSTQQNPVIVYDSAGIFNVTFSAWNSCDSGIQTFTNYVNVGAGGKLTIQPPSSSLCSGQSVTLVITNDTGATFTWSPSLGLSNTTGDSVVANPTATTIYNVTATGTGGCGFEGTDTITSIASPPLYIEPSSTSICPGTSIVLTVLVSGSDYIWSPALSLNPSTGDTVTATPSAQTIYTVTGVDSLGCGVSASDTISISEAPNKPTISIDGNDLVSSATQGNQWLRNDTVIQGATNQTYLANIAGYYQVIASNPANGCSTTSDSTFTTSINQLTIESGQLTVYPNPTGGEINVSISTSALGIKEWSIEIYDVLGRTVYIMQSLNYNNTIDLSNLPGGVYFIAVISKTGKAVVPVVKQ